MNISSGPSSIDFPQQDKYLKPCCTWQSSTKEKVSSILTENLKKVAHLKTCMNKEENLPPIKVSLAFKCLHKAPIPSILEVDESLSDNELYPEMRSISPPSTQATPSKIITNLSCKDCFLRPELTFKYELPKIDRSPLSAMNISQKRRESMQRIAESKKKP